MRAVAALAALLALAACQTAGPTLVTEKYVVVEPPEDLYRCQVVKFPDHETLTDVQVARLIVELHRANVTCQTSLDAVKRYVDKAKETVH